MVQNLKDLEKLLKLCRKQGVTEIDLGSVKFKLGDLPPDPSQEVDTENRDITGFPDGVLTNEQLMFYSSGGVPGQEPDGFFDEKAS